MTKNEQLKQALVFLIEEVEKACREKYDLTNRPRRKRLEQAVVKAREALNPTKATDEQGTL
jgi:hypothetical protein